MSDSLAFTSKIATIFRLWSVVVHCTGKNKKLFWSRLNENAHFFAFAILECCKKVFTQTDIALGIKRFYKLGRRSSY